MASLSRQLLSLIRTLPKSTTRNTGTVSNRPAFGRGFAKPNTRRRLLDSNFGQPKFLRYYSIKTEDLKINGSSSYDNFLVVEEKVKKEIRHSMAKKQLEIEKKNAKEAASKMANQSSKVSASKVGAGDSVQTSEDPKLDKLLTLPETPSNFDGWVNDFSMETVNKMVEFLSTPIPPKEADAGTYSSPTNENNRSKESVLESVKKLASQLVSKGLNESDPKPVTYFENLDTRIRFFTSLGMYATHSESLVQHLIKEKVLHSVVDMIPHCISNSSAMAEALNFMRILLIDQDAIDIILNHQIDVFPEIISSMKSENLQLRIQSTALVALLTAAREAAEKLKDGGATTTLTSILTTSMTPSDQPVFNNGIIALVRIMSASGESAAQALKESQVITALCNIIKKLDRTPDVHDAVITVLSVLSSSQDVCEQILAEDLIPYLGSILESYVKSIDVEVIDHRRFKRITSSNEITEVDDLEAFDGEFDDSPKTNPIYRDSSPEDIVNLIRAISKHKEGTEQVIKNPTIVQSMVNLLESKNAVWSQKLQAANCLIWISINPNGNQMVVKTNISRYLAASLEDSGTTADELAFQTQAISLLARICSDDKVQEHLATRHWLTNVISRTPKTTDQIAKQALGQIILRLLTGERSDTVRDIFDSSDPIKPAIAFLVRQEMADPSQQVIWRRIFASI